MKIQNLIDDILLESRFSPILAYHATSGKYLRSIVKNGLVPNKSAGGWGSSEYSSYGTSSKSMAGVYFTRDVKTAQYITGDVVETDVEPRLIVVCAVQERSAELDEDVSTVIFDVSGVYRKAHHYVYTNFDMLKNQPTLDMLESIIPEVENYIFNKKGDWLNQIFEDHPVLEGIKDKILPTLMVMYKAAVRHSIITEYLIDDRKMIAQTEEQLRQAIDKVNRTVKKLSYIKQHESFKINKTIGFSGANRIIGLIITNYGLAWGKVPPELASKVDEKFNTPAELVKAVDELDI